jgi:hypothetical protein
MYYLAPGRAWAMDLVREACIDGEFKGWAGDWVFDLANGQFWQQVRYRYQYRYACSPVLGSAATAARTFWMLTE